MPPRTTPDESRQSLFQTGGEVGKRDKAVLALSPLCPSAFAPDLRSRGGVQKSVNRRWVANPAEFTNRGNNNVWSSAETETSRVGLIL
jgi:hypothetical protein